MEEEIMDLIVNAGCARSKSMESIMEIKKGHSEVAKKSMEEAYKFLANAHDVQTKLIQEEAAGNKTEINLLMIHAQDHLMNAMTINDLAKEIIEMYEKFS